MTVRELVNNIFALIKKGDLSEDSNVTVHVYVGDGETVEWKDDIFIECFGDKGADGDGLQINVDGEKLKSIIKDS